MALSKSVKKTKIHELLVQVHSRTEIFKKSRQNRTCEINLTRFHFEYFLEKLKFTYLHEMVHIPK